MVIHYLRRYPKKCNKNHSGHFSCASEDSNPSPICFSFLAFIDLGIYGRHTTILQNSPRVKACFPRNF